MDDIATKRLVDWSVLMVDDPYLAPEESRIRLHGKIYGHPDFPHGSEISTSRVIRVDGRLITTRSGNVYYLDGNPSQEYLDFLKSISYVYDPENPIKVIKL